MKSSLYTSCSVARCVEDCDEMLVEEEEEGPLLMMSSLAPENTLFNNNI